MRKISKGYWLLVGVRAPQVSRTVDQPGDVEREYVAEDGRDEKSVLERLSPVVPGNKCRQGKTQQQNQWHVEPEQRKKKTVSGKREKNIKTFAKLRRTCAGRRRWDPAKGHCSRPSFRVGTLPGAFCRGAIRRERRKSRAWHCADPRLFR